MEGGSKSGGEVRRINIVYFLSRKGKVEHPHLIRVYHFHRNGVRLKDVKKWFSELRGTDMPESFAWSYKRRYKAGYVWQDLTDDDLITPISDNEYVLKGSELHSRNDRPLPFEIHSHDYSLNAKESPPPERSLETLQIGRREDTISPTPPPRLDEESPPVLSEDSTKRMAVFKIDMSKKREDEERKKREEEEKQQHDADDHRNFSRQRAASALRNLLGCGSMGTKDSVLLPIKQHEKDDPIGRDLSVSEFHKLRSFSCSGSNQRHDPNNNARKSWSEGGRSSQKMGAQKPMPAAYRPVAEPQCSQCGKTFRPERLHSHMKSCKALRARIKSSNNQEAATKH